MPESNRNVPPTGDPLEHESSLDAVIAAYKRDVDRTLLRENLRLSVEERIRQLTRHLELSHQLRQARRSFP